MVSRKYTENGAFKNSEAWWATYFPSLSETAFIVTFISPLGFLALFLLFSVLLIAGALHHPEERGRQDPV